MADAAEQSLAILSGVIERTDSRQVQLLGQAQMAFTHAMQTTAVIAAIILLAAAIMAARHVPAMSETPEETS